jgi:hypothetical protein
MGDLPPKRRAKRAIIIVLEVVAVVAAVVGIFVPMATPNQVMIFLGSIVVILICVIVSTKIDDEPGSISLFPPKSDK